MPVNMDNNNQNSLEIDAENTNLSSRIHQNTTIVPNVSKNLNIKKANMVSSQTLRQPKKAAASAKQGEVKMTTITPHQTKIFGAVDKGGLVKNNKSYFKMPKLKTSVFAKQAGSPSMNRVSKIKLRPTTNTESVS